MKSIKKRFGVALVFAAILAFCLTGCGGGGGQQSRSADSVGDNTASNTPGQKVVELALNEPVSTDDYDLVFTEAYWESPNEKGNWVYYEENGFTISTKVDEGSVLYLLRGTFTNKGTKACKLGVVSTGKAIFNNKYEYDTKTQLVSNKYEVEALQTKDFYVYVMVPQTMKDQYENAEIKWGLDTSSEYASKLEKLPVIYDMLFK